MKRQQGTILVELILFFGFVIVLDVCLQSFVLLLRGARTHRERMVHVDLYVRKSRFGKVSAQALSTKIERHLRLQPGSATVRRCDGLDRMIRKRSCVTIKIRSIFDGHLHSSVLKYILLQ